MAFSNVYIGINHDSPGFGTDASSFTIQATAPATDFGFWMNALDANGNSIQRIDAIIAAKSFLRVLESNDVFTTQGQSTS